MGQIPLLAQPYPILGIRTLPTANRLCLNQSETELGKPDAGNPPVRFDEGRKTDGHWLCLSIRRFRLLYIITQKSSSPANFWQQRRRVRLVRLGPKNPLTKRKRSLGSPFFLIS